MYADVDSRGLVSVFEIDRQNKKALISALMMAAKSWTLELAEFDGVALADTPTDDLQRRLWLEQNVRSAVALCREMRWADEKGCQQNPFRI